jgi:hypothetical protein
LATTLKDLLNQVEQDTWRQQNGFSADLDEAQRALFDPTNDAESVLSQWIQSNQPCLFGRTAAKLGLLRYCILRESDLSSDENVRDLIQTARRKMGEGSRESDPPIVVGDGNAVHKAKGRAEEQRQQRTDAAARRPRQSVSSSLLAIGPGADTLRAMMRVLLRSPVREFRTPGSVRGLLGNWQSYLDGVTTPT